MHHVGPNGSGARAKLVINMVLGLNRLALAEGLLFGLRQGLDGPALLAVLKDSAAYSRAMDIKGERMLEGRYEPEGKLAQHLKDVDLMLEVGHAAGAPLMATALHRQLLLAGVAAGWSERDNSVDHGRAPLAHRAAGRAAGYRGPGRRRPVAMPWVECRRRHRPLAVRAGAGSRAADHPVLGA